MTKERIFIEVNIYLYVVWIAKSLSQMSMFYEMF